MVELDFFGEGAEFHHIGIAVKSIRDLKEVGEITNDPIQKVSVAFVTLNGVPIEIIEPSDDDSPVLNSLKKGIKILHLCYSVPDIQLAISESRKHGFHCLHQPVPAAAFDNSNIAWIYSNEYGLIELLEKHLEGR